MPTVNELSSRQVMEEIVSRSALIFAQAIKDGNKGNENLILRDIKQIHGNTNVKDLPEHLQKEVKQLVSAMFGYMNAKGYVLVPKDSVK
jgi:hypothetical protein